jgi:hypothetical protein
MQPNALLIRPNFIIRKSGCYTHLERTVLSEKMIEEDFSHVEESATRSTYKLGVGFERCEDKGGKKCS